MKHAHLQTHEVQPSDGTLSDPPVTQCAQHAVGTGAYSVKDRGASFPDNGMEAINPRLRKHP